MLSGFATNEHNHKWQVIVMFSFTTFVIFPLLLAKFPPSLHLCICLYWGRIFWDKCHGFLSAWCPAWPGLIISLFVTRFLMSFLWCQFWCRWISAYWHVLTNSYYCAVLLIKEFSAGDFWLFRWKWQECCCVQQGYWAGSGHPPGPCQESDGCHLSPRWGSFLLIPSAHACAIASPSPPIICPNSHLKTEVWIQN